MDQETRRKKIAELIADGKLPDYMVPSEAFSGAGHCGACNEFGAGKRQPQGSTLMLCKDCALAWEAAVKK